jgi:hypothetical protein
MSKLLCLLLFGLIATGADRGPQPPCGGETFPAYPELNSAPVVKFWDRNDLGRVWTPPACTGWTTPGYSTLVATAGRFRHTGGSAELLRRIGAISELTGVRYWSTTHQRWQTLIVEAHALSGPAADGRRKDFSPDEIVEGKTLYFHQQDNLSGKAVYRMWILSASADRIALSTENVTAMRYFMVTLFDPGEMQSVYFLDRESPEVWRYYSIARTGPKSSSLTAGHAASSINRAVAYYRRLVGIPTDKEPPAAR